MACWAVLALVTAGPCPVVFPASLAGVSDCLGVNEGRVGESHCSAGHTGERTPAVQAGMVWTAVVQGALCMDQSLSGSGIPGNQWGALHNVVLAPLLAQASGIEGHSSGEDPVASVFLWVSGASRMPLGESCTSVVRMPVPSSRTPVLRAGVRREV